MGRLLRTCACAAIALATASVLGSCGSPAPKPDKNIKVVGTLGRQPGQFTKPRAVLMRPDGGLYVIDRSGRIQSLDADGNHINHWWVPAYDNGTPTGGGVDPRDQSLWLADTHYQRLLHYDREGKLLGELGGDGPDGQPRLVFPTCVAVDPDDYSLWISEYGVKNRVFHVTQDGHWLGVWENEARTDADLQRPQSLFVASTGELLVADAGNHRVWRFRRTPGAPEPIGTWGQGGTAPGELKYPYCLTPGPDHTVLICEYGNSRISQFTEDGKFIRTWGGPGHGPGQLFSPWGVGCDPKNRVVWIADSNNDRLQRVANWPK